jgi:UDP-glucose 4-epimerase
MSTKKTRALVTGGAGFIGSHLVDLLLERDYDVTVLDNLSTGSANNLKHLDKGELDFIEGTLLERDDIDSALRGCDLVFHLAALADIVPSVAHPMDYFNANVVGTLNLLEAVRNRDVEKVVYAASSSCYGIPTQYPTPENSPIDPQYPYALTKWMGEEALRHWGKVYGVPYTSLRLFNVYGPRSRTSGTYGAVMGVFLAQRLAAQPLTVVGDGSQSRDFTFVSDVARAFLMAAESPTSGLTLNVGSGGSYTIRDLAGMIGGDIVTLPPRAGEPHVTFADNSLIREKIGWEPEVPFHQGVEQVLALIEDWSEAPVWDLSSIAEATREWHKNLG